MLVLVQAATRISNSDKTCSCHSCSPLPIEHGCESSIAKAGPSDAGSSAGLSTFHIPAAVSTDPPRVSIAVKLAPMQQRVSCHEKAGFIESLDLSLLCMRHKEGADGLRSLVDWPGPLILVTSQP